MLNSAVIRHARQNQVDHLVAGGMARAEASRQVSLATDAQVSQVVTDAAAKHGAALPPECMEPAPGEVGGMFDGHRIKQFEAWLAAHPGVKALIEAGFAILITILISGT